MEVFNNREKGVLVLTVTGRLDANTSGEFEKQLFDFIHAGEEKFILDLKDVDYISSAGLRIFLKAIKSFKDGQGRFHVCGLKDYIREVFEVSGFIKLFPVHESKEAALNAFK